MSFHCFFGLTDLLRSAAGRARALLRVAAVSLVALVAASDGVAAAAPAEGAEQPASDETEVGPAFLIALGGKLYDNVWAIFDRSPPDGRNPALEDVATLLRVDTWRCVTCHGWDYSGVELGGRRFPSLRSLAGASPDAVTGALRNPGHPFPSAELSDTAIEILALFVTSGQYDRSDFISESGKATGNPEFGRDIFEGACISCHQIDGRMFLSGEKGRAGLGAVTREKPTRALHRILNGVPAAEMLSVRFLSEVQIADLLAYLQTLDAGNR